MVQLVIVVNSGCKRLESLPRALCFTDLIGIIFFCLWEPLCKPKIILYFYRMGTYGKDLTSVYIGNVVFWPF